MPISRTKKIFLFSGVYGIVALFPQLFMEANVGINSPPAITHSEFYYGFYGLALTFQMLFILISRDPVKYRPVMIPAIFSKGAFGITVFILDFLHKLHPAVLLFAAVDLCIMWLFIYAYSRTSPQ